MKTVLRIEPILRDEVQKIDPSYEVGEVCDMFGDFKVDTGWVNSPDNNSGKFYTAVTYKGDVPYDKEDIEKYEMFEDTILTFKNLKVLKSIIQTKGDLVMKEAILKMIKSFKKDEYHV